MKTLHLTLFCLIGFALAAFAADDAKKGPKKPDPAKAFAKLDANDDEKVSKTEFVDGQKAWLKPLAEARAKKAGQTDKFAAMWEKRSAAVEKRFTKLDADADGNLSLKELSAAAPARGKGKAKGKGAKPPKKK